MLDAIHMDHMFLLIYDTGPPARFITPIFIGNEIIRCIECHDRGAYKDVN